MRLLQYLWVHSNLQENDLVQALELGQNQKSYSVPCIPQKSLQNCRINFSKSHFQVACIGFLRKNHETCFMMLPIHLVFQLVLCLFISDIQLSYYQNDQRSKLYNFRRLDTISRYFCKQQQQCQALSTHLHSSLTSILEKRYCVLLFFLDILIRFVALLKRYRIIYDLERTKTCLLEI